MELNEPTFFLRSAALPSIGRALGFRSAPRMAKGKHPRVLGRRSALTLALTMLLVLTLVFLLLLALGIVSLPISEDGSPFSDLSSFRRQTSERGNGLGQRGEQWTEVLSWEPRAFVYHNFLSKEECEYLINLAKPHMVKSTVVDSKTGKSKDSRVRTSSGMFLKRGRDKVIRDIEKRIADFTFIPANHGEGLQVLHYEAGQKYDAHFDYFLDEFNTKNGGQRIATLLMYLSDVEEGGETVFPSATGNFSSRPGWDELSECAKQGLSVRPRMGDALLFWSMRPDASLDPSSLHGQCLPDNSVHFHSEVALLLEGTNGHLQSGCILRNTRSVDYRPRIR